MLRPLDQVHAHLVLEGVGDRGGDQLGGTVHPPPVPAVLLRPSTGVCLLVVRVGVRDRVGVGVRVWVRAGLGLGSGLGLV